MIQLKKILVAVDFSEHSNVAFTYAAEFAKMFDAEVLLCHVVGHADLLSQLPPGGEAYFPPSYKSSMPKANVNGSSRNRESRGDVCWSKSAHHSSRLYASHGKKTSIWSSWERMAAERWLTCCSVPSPRKWSARRPALC